MMEKTISILPLPDGRYMVRQKPRNSFAPWRAISIHPTKGEAEAALREMLGGI